MKSPIQRGFSIFWWSKLTPNVLLLVYLLGISTKHPFLYALIDRSLCTMPCSESRDLYVEAATPISVFLFALYVSLGMNVYETSAAPQTNISVGYPRREQAYLKGKIDCGYTLRISHHLALRPVLEKWKLEPKRDVSLVQIGRLADIVPAIQQKRVAAGMLSFSTSFLAEKMGLKPSMICPSPTSKCLRPLLL